MQNLYEATIEKVCYLKEQGFNIVEMWECDLERELEEDERMRRYFEGYDLVDLLQPRDAFFGGRTNATKLFHQCKDQEKIRLVREHMLLLRCRDCCACVLSSFLKSYSSDTWTLPAFIPGVTSQQEW